MTSLWGAAKTEMSRQVAKPLKTSQPQGTVEPLSSCGLTQLMWPSGPISSTRTTSQNTHVHKHTHMQWYLCEGCVDGSWQYAVDVDAVRGPCQRQRFCKRQQRSLGCTIGCLLAITKQACVCVCLGGGNTVRWGWAEKVGGLSTGPNKQEQAVYCRSAQAYC